MTEGDVCLDIKAIVFDKDGTLMDFQQSWGGWAKTVIERLSRDEAEATRVAKAAGVDLSKGLFTKGSPMIAGTPDDIIDILSVELPRYPRSHLFDAITPAPEDFTPVPVPLLVESCKTMRQAGYGFGLVTNDFEEVAHLHLRQLGVAPMFGPVIGFDSGFGGKPAPEGCLAAAKQLEVAPSNCAMVGDSLHDLEAGRAAGMVTIGVLTGVAGRDELSPHADIVLQDVSELPRWLGLRPTR